MQDPAALRRYLSETHFSVPEAVRLLSIHRVWLGQSLQAAAAIKLIHGPLSNAFKGFFSVGFVLTRVAHRLPGISDDLRGHPGTDGNVFKMLIFNLKTRSVHTSGHHCCGLGRGTGEVSLKQILPIKYEPSLVSARGRVWNEKDL